MIEPTVFPFNDHPLAVLPVLNPVILNVPPVLFLNVVVPLAYVPPVTYISVPVKPLVIEVTVLSLILPFESLTSILVNALSVVAD